MKHPKATSDELDGQYRFVFGEVSGIIDAARRSAARSVNAVMTAAYWLIGRYIVEFEQSGEDRAEYGTKLIRRLSEDLTHRFGRGFGAVNLSQMKKFYLLWPSERILQTASEKSPSPAAQQADSAILQTASEKSESMRLQTASADSSLTSIASSFPLPWSAYVRLLTVKNVRAREFYEAEALRGGWSVRQLDRQIDSQFYERTALSRDKAAMLAHGSTAQPEDQVLPEEAIKDPFVLEFLDLKDEYSESDLEEALISRLETFLLELGADFCFMGRQRRLRVGDEWYRVDLLFFHRRLRCLVIIDLKLGRLTHACRCRSDASLSELRAGTLDARRRESARRAHSVLTERRGCCSLRPRRAAEQSDGRRVPDHSPGRATPRIGNRTRTRGAVRVQRSQLR